MLNHKLTTVTGTGGMGKSELCREAGRWLAAQGHFPKGIVFIPLGAVNQADEARLLIAATLGIDVQLAQSAIDLARQLPKDLLLILDEMDKLVQEDALACRTLVKSLVDYGRATLLLSSRYRTNVTGERQQRLQRLSRAAATELFLALAPAELEGSEAELNEVINFLDGFPRAIVQAAKQLFSPRLATLLRDIAVAREEILQDPTIPAEEQRDSDSVFVTLTTSLQKLSQRYPEAAAFFPYLALFPAGISDEGLHAIFGEQARQIRHIAEMALLETTPYLNYYYLPAPVRSFAQRHLPENALAQIGPTALRHYFNVADAYNDLILQGKDEEGQFLFQLELPNLDFFLAWGYDHEPADPDNPVCYTAHINQRMQNFLVYADPGKSRLPHYEKALSAARRIGARLGEANTLQAIGDVRQFRDERDAALEAYNQALDLFRAVGDRLGEANTLKAIGIQQIDQGNGDTGLQTVQTAFNLYEQIGDRVGQANIYWELGRRLANNGAYEEAEPLLIKAVEIGNQIAPGHPTIANWASLLEQVRTQHDSQTE